MVESNEREYSKASKEYTSAETTSYDDKYKLVKIKMSKEALEKIYELKDKTGASTPAEVIEYALSLLETVEENRETPGDIIIKSKRVFPGRDKKLEVPWD
ncbi:MAG: hypothetical protein KAU95_00300 [Candidatus Aenigmarchaeota archaeon]|nr:hypothetical protein [Candidatus Aenigmarchaeota archaeon]